MNNQPVHVTDAEFEKVVLKSELPVVVDFWAPWCGPCRMVAPTLEKLAVELAGKLLIVKINTDEDPEWAMKFGVQGIPTMLFIAGGKLVHQQVGALPEPVLRNLVDQFMTVVKEAAANKPAANKPAANQPAADSPKAEQPAANQPKQASRS